jgi:effector-binding domain-containing protein
MFDPNQQRVRYVLTDAKQTVVIETPGTLKRLYLPLNDLRAAAARKGGNEEIRQYYRRLLKEATQKIAEVPTRR